MLRLLLLSAAAASVKSWCAASDSKWRASNHCCCCYLVLPTLGCCRHACQLLICRLLASMQGPLVASLLLHGPGAEVPARVGRVSDPLVTYRQAGARFLHAGAPSWRSSACRAWCKRLWGTARAAPRTRAMRRCAWLAINSCRVCSCSLGLLPLPSAPAGGRTSSWCCQRVLGAEQALPPYSCPGCASRGLGLN